MAKTKNEKIQELTEWFKTYDCEDTDEVIDNWLNSSDNAIDKPKLTKQELNQEVTDYFNKYRKAQGLPLLDADGNELEQMPIPTGEELEKALEELDNLVVEEDREKLKKLRYKQDYSKRG